MKPLLVGCLIAIAIAGAACDDGSGNDGPGSGPTPAIGSASPGKSTVSTLPSGQATAERAIVETATAVNAAPAATYAPPTPEPTADQNASDAGVPAEDVYLGSEAPPPAITDGREVSVARLRSAMLTADQLGEGYVSVTAEYIPNFRLIEASPAPELTRAVVLAGARVNGYRAAFDHVAPGGVEGATLGLELYANPTGASIAVKRAAELAGSADAIPLPAPEIGEQASLFRIPYTTGVGYLAVFHRGSIMAMVLLTYRTDTADGGAAAVALLGQLDVSLVETPR
ncbi:MAG: hypothetical protein HY873_11050 [Chloroflexi bacterium]|nr:hypothetical protein [Chloroflexota bacterium]